MAEWQSALQGLIVLGSRWKRPVVVAVLVAVLAAGLSLRAGAQDRKTDVVVLTNGDRFTGEIKSLSKGQLSFDMNATGLVSIKWDRVRELTTIYLYEVETAAGERLFGTLAPAGSGTLAVTTEAGVRRALDIQAIVGLAPIGKSFLKRLDGAIDLGGSYSQSGGVAQVWVNYWMRQRRPSIEWRVAFDDYLTLKSDGGSGSEQLTGSFSVTRYVSGRWAIFGLSQVERNPDLGFDVRGTFTGGVQYMLQRTNRSEIAIGAGLGASQEQPVEGDPETQLPAILAFRQSFFIYDTPKTTLESQFTAYPILNQSGRWRLKTDGTIKREIFKDFTVGLTIYDSFDSRPSSAGARRNDVGTTLSLGYTF